MAARKKKSGAAVAEETEPSIRTPSSNGDALDPADRYVGQWNRLVSTTNWEKGRIICQWRNALIAAGAAVSDYSDEAWSQLVGGVTSQHVGRLRRAFQRFGEVFDQYDGLYWSHFQSALEWEDAEMWLEGAIHNGWSVSQMRGKRWETVGKPGEPMPADELAAETAVEDEPPWMGDENAAGTTASERADSPESADATSAKGSKNRDKEVSDEEEGKPTARSLTSTDDQESPKSPAKARTRLGVEVDELPEDLADAFEQFKLAIIAQRRLGWSETTPDAVLECLDALRELALAPADD
jgi:hypothetical protein